MDICPFMKHLKGAYWISLFLRLWPLFQLHLEVGLFSKLCSRNPMGMSKYKRCTKAVCCYVQMTLCPYLKELSCMYLLWVTYQRLYRGSQPHADILFPFLLWWGLDQDWSYLKLCSCHTDLMIFRLTFLQISILPCFQYWHFPRDILFSSNHLSQSLNST